MKKTFATIVALLVISLTGQANDVTKSDAKRIATEFMAQRNANTSKAKANGSSELMTVTTINANVISGNVINGSGNGGNQPIAYACNYANGGGFVLVASDDCVNPILGYSDQGNIDLGNMPENMKGWLASISDQIDAIKSGKAVAVERTTQAADAEVVVDALVKTHWNQEEPYNNMCPEECYTGCVATALAQIMNYHQWPAQGTGSNSYICEIDSTTTLELSTDFSQSTYDWDNMLPIYTANNWNEAEANAVAKLIYDCGVASNMIYGKKGSGTIEADAAYGASHYFNYLTNIYFHDTYSTAEFEAIIQTELNNSRPVLFSASASSKVGGGHTFIVDGYRSDGMYHVNWGWNGLNEGFFSLCIMNAYPERKLAYHNQQSIITLTPNKANSTEKFSRPLVIYYYENGVAYGGYSLDSDYEGDIDSISVNMSVAYILNYSCRDYDGMLGIAIYDEKGEQVIVDWDEFHLSPNGTSQLDGLPLSIIDFASLGDGDYTMQLVTKEKDGDEYMPEQKMIAMSPRDRINITIAGSTIKISDIKIETPSIALADSIALPKQLAFGTKSKYSISLKNTSSTSLEAELTRDFRKAGSDNIASTNDIADFVLYDWKQVDIADSLKFTYGEWIGREEITEGDYEVRYSLLDVNGDTIQVDGLGEWMPLTLYLDESSITKAVVDSVLIYEYGYDDEPTRIFTPSNVEIDKNINRLVTFRIYYHYNRESDVDLPLRIGDMYILKTDSVKGSYAEFVIFSQLCELELGEYDLPIEFQNEITSKWQQVEGAPSSIHFKVTNSATGINAVENGNANGNAKIYDINGSPASSTSRGLKIVVEPKTGKAKKVLRK